MKYKKIIAVLDPMCSWCYAFEPELNKLRNHLGEIELELVMGGLRGANAQIWNEEFKYYLKANWMRISELTKQKFNYQLFEQTQFDYNTEPACRAVVTVRSLDSAKVFPFFSVLQKHFYQLNQDTTDDVVIAKIALQTGIDEEQFTSSFTSAEMKRQTQLDFQRAKGLGVNSFPTLVLMESESKGKLLSGYRDFEAIKAIIESDK